MSAHAHAGICDCRERAHTNTKRERQVEKGGLSVQLAFCSAGSNVACLPARPPQTGASPLGTLWDLLPATQPDRGAV